MVGFPLVGAASFSVCSSAWTTEGIVAFSPWDLTSIAVWTIIVISCLVALDSWFFVGVCLRFGRGNKDFHRSHPFPLFSFLNFYIHSCLILACWPARSRTLLIWPILVHALALFCSSRLFTRWGFWLDPLVLGFHFRGTLSSYLICSWPSCRWWFHLLFSFFLILRMLSLAMFYRSEKKALLKPTTSADSWLARANCYRWYNAMLITCYLFQQNFQSFRPAGE